MTKIYRYLCLFLVATCGNVWSAITVDRTRVVFDANKKTESIIITNKDLTKPYLAQAWLEDEQRKKMVVDSPLIITPPVTRVEPNEKKIFRIVKTPMAKNLSKDRESLFYLNVREVPPKNNDRNVLQVALQTSMKLIYRPDEISLKHGDFKGDQIKLVRIQGGFNINNPTPYYYTVVGFSELKDDKKQEGFTSFMLAPHSVHTLNIPDIAGESKVWITFVNDFGGRVQLPFIVH